MWPMKDLGRIVRRERERRGMRGLDLAVAIGRDPSYVSRLERGTLKEIPAPDTLHALGQTLAISDARLLAALGYVTTESAETADPTPDPLAALVATFSPAQRRMLLDLLDRANVGALEEAADARLPRRTTQR